MSSFTDLGAVGYLNIFGGSNAFAFASALSSEDPAPASAGSVTITGIGGPALDPVPIYGSYKFTKSTGYDPGGLGALSGAFFSGTMDVTAYWGFGGKWDTALYDTTSGALTGSPSQGAGNTFMAPGMGNGFPFVIGQQDAIWGGDLTQNPLTVCGPGTPFPIGMTLQQMMQLYWRALAWDFNLTAKASDYGSTILGIPLENLVFGDIITPTDPTALTLYYQNSIDSGVVPYNTDSVDNGMPYPLLQAVCQQWPGSAPSGQSNGPTLVEGNYYTLGAAGPAWSVTLFQHGALQIGQDYYPSIEIALGGPVTLATTENPVGA